MFAMRINILFSICFCFFLSYPMTLEAKNSSIVFSFIEKSKNPSVYRFTLFCDFQTSNERHDCLLHSIEIGPCEKSEPKVYSNIGSSYFSTRKIPPLNSNQNLSVEIKGSKVSIAFHQKTILMEQEEFDINILLKEDFRSAAIDSIQAMSGYKVVRNSKIHKKDITTVLEPVMSLTPQHFSSCPVGVGSSVW